jgi:hypothetical protein
MDCDLARQLARFARPGELEAADAAALDRHLADCPTCATLVRGERAFDTQLARAMRAVPIPTGGRQRLAAHLLAARAAWWRRLWLCVGSALAVVVGGGIGWYYWSRPALDPAAVAQAAYEQSGLWRSNDEARETATAWLRQIHSGLRAPDELNYKLLAFEVRSDFAGLTSVPTLVFVRGDATARVYVVGAHAFRNLRALGEQPFEEGGCTVTARRYADMPGWVFILVTAGAPPDAFLRPAGPQPPA